MCNWVVSTGVVAAMMSTSVSGMVIATWMPILVFFYLGFEHSIVNMFLFPSGLLLGGNFTSADYIFWNELPTVVGKPGRRPDLRGRDALLDALQDPALAPGYAREPRSDDRRGGRVNR